MSTRLNFWKRVFFLFPCNKNPYACLASHLGLRYIRTIDDTGALVFIDNTGEHKFVLTKYGFISIEQYNLKMQIAAANEKVDSLQFNLNRVTAQKNDLLVQNKNKLLYKRKNELLQKQLLEFQEIILFLKESKSSLESKFIELEKLSNEQKERLDQIPPTNSEMEETIKNLQELLDNYDHINATFLSTIKQIQQIDLLKEGALRKFMIKQEAEKLISFCLNHTFNNWAGFPALFWLIILESYWEIYIFWLVIFIIWINMYVKSSFGRKYGSSWRSWT